jgi:HEXXH motif-containing protein
VALFERSPSISEGARMRVLPDEIQAARQRDAVGQVLMTVLDRIAPQVLRSAARFVVAPQALTYPGVFAAAYDAQNACRAGSPSPDGGERLARCVDRAVQRARDSQRRRAKSGCRAWEVDLAPAEEHLCASLARAVSQVPPRPERAEALAALRIAAWSDADRVAFCDATCILADRWPAMLAELRVVVQQVALIDGFGIDGFTDVATHGAVYINRARTRADDAQLPGAVRFAEALVHEGAHNSCNAAALTVPFLADARSGSEPVVMTPLRADPRPLTGLLQQLVVLVRTLLLYDRLAPQPSIAATAAVAARRDKLCQQATEALRVISAHTAKLTHHGRAVVTESSQLLAGRPALGELAVT